MRSLLRTILLQKEARVNIYTIHRSSGKMYRMVFLSKLKVMPAILCFVKLLLLFFFFWDVFHCSSARLLCLQVTVLSHKCRCSSGTALSERRNILNLFYQLIQFAFPFILQLILLAGIILFYHGHIKLFSASVIEILV